MEKLPSILWLGQFCIATPRCYGCTSVVGLITTELLVKVGLVNFNFYIFINEAVPIVYELTAVGEQTSENDFLFGGGGGDSSLYKCLEDNFCYYIKESLTFFNV